jgi:uncharacterized membrane protein
MQWTDEKMERIIGTLLRVGVGMSAAVVVSGAVWHLAAHGGDIPRYGIFRGEPADLRSVTGVWRGLWAGDARSLIQIGLMLLIATPVARVAFASAAFAMERDRTYVVISLLVLAVLLYGLSGH